jgi:hypothetical protein
VPEYTAQTIIFQKMHHGDWLKDDGEVRTNMNEEAMFREIAKLINEGWGPVRTEGLTRIQMIEIIR